MQEVPFANPALSTEQFDRGRLIILCGLTGSGKTTLARFLADRLGAVRYSSDEWMQARSIDLDDRARRDIVEANQWKAAKRLLVRGRTAIIEWGTWRRSEREKLRLEARALGASVELIYLEAPLSVLNERIRQRGTGGPSPEMMKARARDFQAPTPEELALFDLPENVL